MAETSHHAKEPAQRQRRSAYRGLSYHPSSGRVEAHIYDKGKQIYLGSFLHEEVAAMAYDLAAVQARGLQAVTNLPQNLYARELDQRSAVTMEALVQSLRAQAKAMGSFQPAPAPLEPWERQLSQAVSGQTSLGSFPCEADAARAVDAGLLVRDGLAAAPMLAFPLATYAASLSPQLFLEALQQGLLQLPAAAAHPQPTDQPPAAYAPIAGTTAAECCMLPPVPQPVARKASMTPRVLQQG